MRRFRVLISLLLTVSLFSYYFIPTIVYAATAYEIAISHEPADNVSQPSSDSEGGSATEEADQDQPGSSTESEDEESSNSDNASSDLTEGEEGSSPNDAASSATNAPTPNNENETDAPSAASDGDLKTEESEPTDVEEELDASDPASLAAAHVGDLPDGTYTIASQLSSSALVDAKGAGKTAGTVVQIYASNETDAQVWRVYHDGDYVIIASAISGLVLDIKGGKATDKAALQLNVASSSLSQRWIAQLEDDGSYTFISALDTSMVIDLNAAKTINGTAVQVYSANGTDAQSWCMSPAMTKQETLDTLAQEHAADLPDGSYVLMPQKSDDVAIGDSSSQASLNYVSYRDSIIWTVSHDEQGYVTFINKSSGLALDVNGAKTTNATKVQSYSSNNTKAQKWIAEQQQDGSYRIISALDPSVVLDTASGSTKSGNRIQIYSDNGTAAQRWVCLDIASMRDELDNLAAENKDVLADGTYAIVVGDVERRMVVDVASGSKDNGANVQLYTSNATDAQRWTVTHDSMGYVTFTSVGSGKVLDVSSGYANDSRNVQQYSGNDSLAQKWIVIENSDGGRITLSICPVRLETTVSILSSTPQTKRWHSSTRLNMSMAITSLSVRHLVNA